MLFFLEISKEHDELEDKLNFLEKYWENNIREFFNACSTISELPSRILKAEQFCVSASGVLQEQMDKLSDRMDLLDSNFRSSVTDQGSQQATTDLWRSLERQTKN